jgi:hypothetical protein
MLRRMKNIRHVSFVNHYCAHGKKTFQNGTQAAIAAGFSPKTATRIACGLLKRTDVREAIQQRRQELIDAAKITNEWVLQRWVAIAEANPNDIAQVRRVNCRYCWGLDNRYQWTAAEYQEAVEKAVEAGRPVPDGIGGFGFNCEADPNPACPECAGVGDEVVHVSDTRKLSGAAKALYAGVERTRDGLKVKLRDQDAALANIAKAIGMNVERKEISGPGGSAISLSVSAADLTDDQLAAVVAGNAID